MMMVVVVVTMRGSHRLLIELELLSLNYRLFFGADIFLLGEGGGGLWEGS